MKQYKKTYATLKQLDMETDTETVRWIHTDTQEILKENQLLSKDTMSKDKTVAS